MDVVSLKLCKLWFCKEIDKFIGKSQRIDALTFPNYVY